MPTCCVTVLDIGDGETEGTGGKVRESVAPCAGVVTDPVACIGLVPTTTTDCESFPGTVDRFLTVDRA